MLGCEDDMPINNHEGCPFGKVIADFSFHPVGQGFVSFE